MKRQQELIKRPNHCVLLSHDLFNYKIYTTYQFTYSIDVFNQEVTIDPKITLILTQYLHQKKYTKHVWNVENNVKIRLNINQIGFTGEPVTG